jgi:ADP-ribose pyrophosphatase
MSSEGIKQEKLPNIGPREVVYKNDFQQVYRVEADFGNFVKEYFVTDFGWHSGILVVREESVLLVRQYRLLINKLSWEIPGGRVDDGETPEAAAIRECLEETGIRCFNPLPLIHYHIGLDTTYCPTYIFYTGESAIDNEPGHMHKHEISSFEWVPLTQCLEMTREQKIIDSFTILALYAYHRHLNSFASTL